MIRINKMSTTIEEVSSQVDNKQEERKVTPKTIVVALHNNEYSKNWLLCWTNLLGYCNQVGHKMIVSQSLTEFPFVCRNQCLGGNTIGGTTQKPFEGKLEYDYVLFLDGKTLFNPQMIQDLLDADVQVATAFHLVGGQSLNTVDVLDISILRKGEAISPMKFEDYYTDKFEPKSKDLVKVEYTDFSCLLVQKGLFENMTYPWFTAQMQEFVKDGTYIRDYSSEELSFCMDLKRQGVSIHAVPTVLVQRETRVIL